MNKKKISIVGRGMDPQKNLTLAAIRCLKSADCVLGIEPQTQTWADLQKEFSLPEIHDVSSLYVNGAHDLDNYRHFIAHVLELSEKHSHVSLLVAGHPRLGVTFIAELSKAVQGQAELEVVEGLSSFDVMINGLALDPLERGVGLIDANRMLLFEYQLEPSVGYFIYHVCSVGNSKTDYRAPDVGNKLETLKSFLSRFYSNDKMLFLCRASSASDQRSTFTPIALSNLANAGNQIDFGTTLYIPANNPSKINREFLETLRTSS